MPFVTEPDAQTACSLESGLVIRVSQAQHVNVIARLCTKIASTEKG